MKVRIAFTVVVDADEWDDTYGTGTNEDSVRDDVRKWAVSAVSNHPDGLIELVSER